MNRKTPRFYPRFLVIDTIYAKISCNINIVYIISIIRRIGFINIGQAKHRLQRADSPARREARLGSTQRKIAPLKKLYEDIKSWGVMTLRPVTKSRPEGEYRVGRQNHRGRALLTIL